VLQLAIDDPEYRFIPTRVGNRIGGEIIDVRNPVHPHACGEQARYAQKLLASDGSSPRVWGTAREVELDEHGRRFIPTRVGNRSTTQSYLCADPVHPHACGEQP